MRRWGMSQRGRVVHCVDDRVRCANGAAVYLCGDPGKNFDPDPGKARNRVRCARCCRLAGVDWYGLGIPA